MVVYVHDWNFSTTDSSLIRSSIGTDEALWDSTAPQSPGGLSLTGHTVVAVCLGFILVAGILSNFLTLLTFARFRSLWTPINLIQLDISLSDILVCVFGTPFSFAASLRGRWLIGEYACKWYGFAKSLFGIVSLVSYSISPRLISQTSGRVMCFQAQRREHHILVMVFSMVSCYMLCWMPYSIMALMATFGGSGLVTPIASDLAERSLWLGKLFMKLSKTDSDER